MTKDETKEFIMSHLGLDVHGSGNELYISLAWLESSREPETISSHTVDIGSNFEITATLTDSYLDKDMP